MGTYDGRHFTRRPASDQTFHRELRPISEEFQEEALAINGLDRSRILEAFGHLSCLDIRTLYQAAAGTVFDQSGKDAMPDFLSPRAPHTHDALDDAVEQGELFANIASRAARRRKRHRLLDEPEGGEPTWLTSRVMPIA